MFHVQIPVFSSITNDTKDLRCRFCRHTHLIQIVSNNLPLLQRTKEAGIALNMKTRIVAVGVGFEEALALLRSGQPVAVPTETVYGLAADATIGGAVAAIYSAKGRPSFNPLIVHVDGMAMAQTIGVFDDQLLQLASNFWNRFEYNQRRVVPRN